MRRSSAFILLFVITLLSYPDATAAQSSASAAPAFEIGALPVGAVTFTEGDSGAPGFTNYVVAGTFTVNFNRFLGVEGELGGNFGVDQELGDAAGPFTAQTPHQFTYAGSVVYHVSGTGRAVVPYVIGGAGGMRVFERTEAGQPDDTDLFVLNVGGGVKFRLTDRWGLRADYRFLTAFAADDAPVFFGGYDENRFGHRIAGGLTVSFGG